MIRNALDIITALAITTACQILASESCVGAKETRWLLVGHRAAVAEVSLGMKNQ